MGHPTNGLLVVKTGKSDLGFVDSILPLCPHKSQVMQWVGDSQLFWLHKDFVKGEKI